MSFHDVIHTVLNNIGFLLKVTIISVLLIFLVLLFIYPVTYEAEVSVLPPEQKDETSALSSLLGDRSLSGFFSFGMHSANSQLFVEILKSRSAALHVVRRLNLTSFLGKDDEIDAANYLSKKLNIDLTKEGIIKLNVDISSSFIPWLLDDKDSLKKHI